MVQVDVELRAHSLGSACCKKPADIVLDHLSFLPQPHLMLEEDFSPEFLDKGSRGNNPKN